MDKLSLLFVSSVELRRFVFAPSSELFWKLHYHEKKNNNGLNIRRKADLCGHNFYMLEQDITTQILFPFFSS